jgi:hypothetical protein
MINKAIIVRDNNGNVYLKVSGKPLDNSVCFKIEEFVTEPEGKIINLSKEFEINLKEE